MASEIYLSLERQEDTRDYFSFALVYRGYTDPESACAMTAQLDDSGRFNLEFQGSDGFQIPGRFPSPQTRQEAEEVMKRVLSEKAKQLRFALGIQKDLVDKIQ